MVLLKIIEFLYFHKHHRKAELTTFKAKFLLLEIQNRATVSKFVPKFFWKKRLTNDQIFLATTQSKKINGGLFLVQHRKHNQVVWLYVFSSGCL